MTILDTTLDPPLYLGSSVPQERMLTYECMILLLFLLTSYTCLTEIPAN